MRSLYLVILLCLLFLLPSTTFGYGHYTIYSPVPADVYVDNEYSATIMATQSLKLILSGPQTYVIGVRAHGTEETYKESVTVGTNLNEHRDIRAFSKILTSPPLPKAEITVYSGIPAEVFIDNVLKTAIDSTHPMAIVLTGPHLYVFEVRGIRSNMIFREEVRVELNSNIKREIRAFSEGMSQTTIEPKPVETTEVTQQATVPQGGISREEMADSIAKAKAEALSEEAGRRKRADKRAVTNKGIAHIVGVEANPGLSGSVKNMERIKLLMEALPSFGK